MFLDTKNLDAVSGSGSVDSPDIRRAREREWEKLSQFSPEDVPYQMAKLRPQTPVARPLFLSRGLSFSPKSEYEVEQSYTDSNPAGVAYGILSKINQVITNEEQDKLAEVSKLIDPLWVAIRRSFHGMDLKDARSLVGALVGITLRENEAETAKISEIVALLANIVVKKAFAGPV